MTLQDAPHRPTAEEHEAGLRLGMPADDGHADAVLQTVDTALRLSLAFDAMKVLRMLIRVRPDDVRLYHRYAQAHQLAGEHEAALRCFEEVISLEPDHAEALLSAGEMCWRLRRDKPRARAHLLRAAAAGDPAVVARARVTLKLISRHSSFRAA